jgi:hypothetical protein
MDYGKLNSHTWDDHIPAPMGPGEAAAFQQKLDELAGVEPDGSPRLRLAWAPDCEEWNVYLKKPATPQWALWRIIRDGVEQASPGSILLQPKFKLVAAPRYVLLGRVTEASRMGDTRDRTFSEADGTSVEEREQPVVWRKVLWIWKHTEQDVQGTPLCCMNRLMEHRTRCFGEFRKPDEYDLQFVARLFQQWSAQYQAAAHERLTEKDKARIISETGDFYAGQQADVDAESAYISRSEDNNDWYKRPNDSVKGKFSLPEG